MAARRRHGPDRCARAAVETAGSVARLPIALVRVGLSNDLNVHGLRKLAAAELADAGCSVHEIASITGHKSLSMVQLYTRSADQERLASAAIVRLSEQKTNGQTNKKSLDRSYQVMRAIFVMIKCEMGQAYKVAREAADRIEEMSELFSTSGSMTCWGNSIWIRSRTSACS